MDLKDFLDKCLVKGFWGELTITIQDGKIVVITEKRTHKVN